MTGSVAVEASAGHQPIVQEIATYDLENENNQPTEPSAEEQIKILKTKIKDLEEQVEESNYSAETIFKNSELLSFYTGSVSKERFDSLYSWVEPYVKTMIKWSQIHRERFKKENYKRRRSSGNFALSLSCLS